jgi:ubiquinone/menaquinone biosynthesis C-methylase UbiE
VADVGGGDGEFACDVAAKAGMSLDRVVVVEPSSAMLTIGRSVRAHGCHMCAQLQ